MKKVLLKIALFVFVFTCVFTARSISSNAIARSECNGRGDDLLLNVVIFDEQSVLSQAVMAGIKKHWTCCKYEFINTDQLKTRCQSNGFFLVVLGASADQNSRNFGALAILKMDAMAALNSGNSFTGPISVRTDKKTNDVIVSYDQSTVAIGIENNKVNSGPDFYLALMNDIFEQKFVKSIKKRCFDGTNETPEGIFYFENYSADSIKEKSLLIDRQTADKMLKCFSDEATLKKIVSKTTGIPVENISILSTAELCESFNSGQEDLLYMYTYYSFIEIHQQNNIGSLWMAPNILDYKGRFVASLDNYKNLKKLHE
jgi:hypothetical protein